jgi:urea transport system ATP-binding protein
LFRAVGLDFRTSRPAGTLSHGQKQWLELAMVLATGPRLVLLDEPAAGMTRPEKGETLRLLARLREETGVGVLLIEHDMDFVEALDCPVSVMVLGRIVAVGSFEEVRLNPLVREAYLGSRQPARAAHG